MQLIGDPAPDILGNSRGTAREMGALGHIEVSLVQRQGLDQLGVIAKDGLDFLRRLSIGFHPRLDDDQVRAQLQCMSRRHRRPYPKGSCLIVAGCNDAPPVRRTTHGQRLAGQRRVVTHLDGSIKAVAVDVDDFALRHIKAVFNEGKGTQTSQITSISLTTVYSTSTLSLLY
ncbi:hypothetical protein D3C84_823910 [compost metagenome]